MKTSHLPPVKMSASSGPLISSALQMVTEAQDVLVRAQQYLLSRQESLRQRMTYLALQVWYGDQQKRYPHVVKSPQGTLWVVEGSDVRFAALVRAEVRYAVIPGEPDHGWGSDLATDPMVYLSELRVVVRREDGREKGTKRDAPVVVDPRVLAEVLSERRLDGDEGCGKAEVLCAGDEGVGSG